MNEQIYNMRRDFDGLGNAYEKSANVNITKEVIEGVDCYWFHPKETVNKNNLIIYLHGGCYVLGSIQSHRSLVSHLSEQLALPILFIEYSLAPEKPFPAAINEIEKVYHKILSRYAGNDIILMGDSAGGGLAISIISKDSIPSPKYLVMFSPWVDLTCKNESLVKNKDTDPILTKKILEDCASLYVNDHTLSEANPIENINNQFPPTLIFVGSGEILLDDSQSIHNNATLRIYDNENHVWLLADIFSDASKKAITEIKEFIAG